MGKIRVKVMDNICRSYEIAQKKYKSIGINTDAILKKFSEIAISINIWHLDDCTGFEHGSSKIGNSGTYASGNYIGRPENIEEVQDDLAVALSLIPGKKKINLHAKYGDFNKDYSDRNKIKIEDFTNWVDFARKNNLGIDFNPTFSAHPLSSNGFTLSSLDPDIRDFWVEHVKATRKIANQFGNELGIPCINNIWIPDGSKDIIISKLEHREILKDSLDKIFETKYPEDNMMDSLESKLFGIGLESYTVGSNEFYLGYAVKNDKLITLDAGHFHPTENIADKISAIIPFIKGIFLHLTRGVRWDSDHIPLLSDELISIMQEIMRSDSLDKIYLGTDFFDGTINRVGGLVIGVRAVQKALLYAMLEPLETLRDLEINNDGFSKIAFIEGLKTLPFGDIWNYYLNSNNISLDFKILDCISEYEKKFLFKRERDKRSN